MKQQRHRISALDLERKRAGNSFCRSYMEFEVLYSRRRFKDAEVLLRDLFVESYESYPDEIYRLMLAEAAVKAESGQLMKAIRLNRALLAELRKHESLSEIEVMASVNLINDLNSLGYSVGAISEAKTAAQRIIEPYLHGANLD